MITPTVQNNLDVFRREENTQLMNEGIMLLEAIKLMAMELRSPFENLLVIFENFVKSEYKSSVLHSVGAMNGRQRNLRRPNRLGLEQLGQDEVWSS
jgi:uncharacterized protein YoaH (UPF0181 family)